MNLSACSCGKLTGDDSNLAFGFQEQPIIQGDAGWGASDLARGLDWPGCGNLEDVAGSAGGNSRVKFGKHWRKGSLEQQQGALGASCPSLSPQPHPEEGPGGH